MEHEAPSENPRFIEYWDMYIDSIKERDNFQVGHLQHLKILCNALVEYDDLTEIIAEEGYTFTSMGRNGEQIKPHPAVAIRKTTVGTIKDYSGLLDIKVDKDKAGEKEDGDEDEWD